MDLLFQMYLTIFIIVISLRCMMELCISELVCRSRAGGRADFIHASLPSMMAGPRMQLMVVGANHSIECAYIYTYTNDPAVVDPRNKVLTNGTRRRPAPPIK